MKKNSFLWGLGGFTFTSVMGTLLHFLYELSGGRLWAAVISGVNESTWEHMKLLFWPLFLFALILTETACLVRCLADCAR